MNIFEEVKRIALQGVMPPTPARKVPLQNATPEICEYMKPEYVCLGLDEYAEFMQTPGIFAALQSTSNGPDKFWGVEIIRTVHRSHFSYGWKI